MPDLAGTTTATDNCDNDVTVTQVPAAGTVIGLGNTVVTLTATDDAGKTDVCAVTLTVDANGCNAGGGGAPAPTPDPTSGSGTTDATGGFAQAIADTDGNPLAEINVRGADPGVTIDYNVDKTGTAGAPGGTTFGFGDGVALGRTLTVETTAAPGTFRVTVSMVFTPAELAAASVTADAIELHVLDESATPPVWVPAGANVGMSNPTGIPGDSGYFTDADGNIVFWVERDALSTFAVGVPLPPEPEPEPTVEPQPTVTPQPDAVPSTPQPGEAPQEAPSQPDADREPVTLFGLLNLCGGGVGQMMIVSFIGLGLLQCVQRRRWC